MKWLVLLLSIVFLAGCSISDKNPTDALAIKYCKVNAGERIIKRFSIINFKFYYKCFDSSGSVVKTFVFDDDYRFSTEIK